VTDEARRGLVRADLRRSATEKLPFRRARWLRFAVLKFSSVNMAWGKVPRKGSGLWMLEALGALAGCFTRASLRFCAAAPP